MNALEGSRVCSWCFHELWPVSELGEDWERLDRGSDSPLIRSVAHKGQFTGSSTGRSPERAGQSCRGEARISLPWCDLTMTRNPRHFCSTSSTVDRACLYFTILLVLRHRRSPLLGSKSPCDSYVCSEGPVVHCGLSSAIQHGFLSRVSLAQESRWVLISRDRSCCPIVSLDTIDSRGCSGTARR